MFLLNVPFSQCYMGVSCLMTAWESTEESVRVTCDGNPGRCKREMPSPRSQGVSIIKVALNVIYKRTSHISERATFPRDASPPYSIPNSSTTKHVLPFIRRQAKFSP